MSARIHEVFNKLVEDRQISVVTPDELAHENLRTRLVKLFSRHKDTLEDMGASDETADMSLCAERNLVSKVSTFWIKKSKKQNVEYEIVSPKHGN